MFPPMLTSFYTRRAPHSQASRMKTGEGDRSFEKFVLSYFQRIRPKSKHKSLYATGRQKKLECFGVKGFCSHCNTMFEAMVCL